MSVGKPEARNHLRYLGVSWRIILKHFQEMDLKGIRREALK
jgi:hypothetical protein